MIHSDATDTTVAPRVHNEDVMKPGQALPRIDLDAPGMPIPSLDEFLRQAAVLHGALIAARPLLYVEAADVKAAAGKGLPDLIELAVAGKHWATSVWSLFCTVEDHLQAAGQAPAR